MKRIAVLTSGGTVQFTELAAVAGARKPVDLRPFEMARMVAQ